MARRVSYPNKKFWQRPEGAYARSDSWSTRYYHRKTGGTIIATMSGLNVTDSDYTKKLGESPYLVNSRLNGTKETRARAQSMSRPGQRFLGMPVDSEVKHERPKSDGLNWYPVKEFQSIKYYIEDPARITSLGFYLRRVKTTPSNAYFLAIIRKPDTGIELCRAFYPVRDLTENEELLWFRLIRTLKGKMIIELTLIDDLNSSGASIDSGVEVLFTGENNHEFADHGVPNLDKALREKPYVYEPGVGQPLTSYKTTTWETFPVWIQNGYFTAEKKRWVPVGVIDNNGNKRIFKYPYLETISDGSAHQRVTSDVVEMIPAAKINQNATQVRMTQAGDGLYFVDGYSALQRVRLKTWVVENAVPTSTDLFGFVANTYYYKNSVIFQSGQVWRAKADFQAGASFNTGDWTSSSLGQYAAWPAASLIYFLNNRIFLAGFYRETVGNPPEGPQSDPTLVIMSSIDSVAPKYDFFNKTIEFFHTPDKANAAVATSPITAFADLNDNLIVYRADALGFISVPSGIEFGQFSQSTPEGAGYGVLRQEHVTQGRNNVYFFNPTEGVMRLGGSISTVVSKPVDALLQRIVNPEKVYVQLHKDAFRLYYHESGETNDSCLYNYASYAIHKSYWYRDSNTPIAYMNSDNGYDVEIGVGSEYPCVVEAEVFNDPKTIFYYPPSEIDPETEEPYPVEPVELTVYGGSDFGCSIVYEYHTNYLSTPSKVNSIIVRRLHVSSMQDFNASIFIGLDVDHKDNPIVFRRFIQYNAPDTTDATDIFEDTEDRGPAFVSARILTDDVRLAQLRVKQFCYESQAAILQIGLEYGESSNL